MGAVKTRRVIRNDSVWCQTRDTAIRLFFFSVDTWQVDSNKFQVLTRAAIAIQTALLPVLFLGMIVIPIPPSTI